MILVHSSVDTGGMDPAYSGAAPASRRFVLLRNVDTPVQVFHFEFSRVHL